MSTDRLLIMSTDKLIIQGIEARAKKAEKSLDITRELVDMFDVGTPERLALLEHHKFLNRLYHNLRKASSKAGEDRDEQKVEVQGQDKGIQAGEGEDA